MFSCSYLCDVCRLYLSIVFSILDGNKEKKTESQSEKREAPLSKHRPLKLEEGIIFYYYCRYYYFLSHCSFIIIKRHDPFAIHEYTYLLAICRVQRRVVLENVENKFDWYEYFEISVPEYTTIFHPQ